MQREDVERLERWSYVEDVDLDHHGFQLQDNGGLVRYVDVIALLDRAEKAEAEREALRAVGGADAVLREAVIDLISSATELINQWADPFDDKDDEGNSLYDKFVQAAFLDMGKTLENARIALARPSAPETMAWARAQERAAQVPRKPGFLETLSAEELMADEDGDIRVGDVAPD